MGYMSMYVDREQYQVAKHTGFGELSSNVLALMQTFVLRGILKPQSKQPRL